jgi:hypothetical protein
MRSNMVRIAPKGTASSTMSASLTAAAGSWVQPSMTPRSNANSRFSAERPQPITSPTIPAARNARASEPPMRPTPMIASRSIMR